MQRKDRGFVGIELRHDGSRAVYVRRCEDGVEVVGAAHALTPEGGVVNGVIPQPKVAGPVLKRLLEGIGAPPGVDAVIGLQNDGIFVRTLNVPPTPDAEMPAIVAGEVEHYHILPTKGVHAFALLTPPIPLAAGKPQTVLVAAAEEQLTQSLGELASAAGVRLTAVEPVEFGMLRSASAVMDRSASEFVIVVGQESTDLAAFVSGKLCSYRRVELGVNQLLADRWERPMLRVVGEADTAPPKYSYATVDSFCDQIDRSIDFLGREFKEHAQFSKLRVCVVDAGVADIGPYISERIAVPVLMVEPCTGAEISSDVSFALEGPEGVRYGGAFGLAMRGYGSNSIAVPLMDLFAQDRAKAESRIVRRNLTGSLATSGAAVVIGLGTNMLYGGQISTVKAQSATLKARAAALQSDAEAVTEKHASRHRKIVLLSDFGIPEQAVTDAIATSIEPGVGIESLAVNGDKTLLIDAQAASEASMLATVKRLQTIPILRDVMIQSFANNAATGGGLTFTVSAKTLPLSQVELTPSAMDDPVPTVDASKATSGQNKPVIKEPPGMVAKAPPAQKPKVDAARKESVPSATITQQPGKHKGGDISQRRISQYRDLDAFFQFAGPTALKPHRVHVAVAQSNHFLAPPALAAYMPSGWPVMFVAQGTSKQKGSIGRASSVSPSALLVRRALAWASRPAPSLVARPGKRSGHVVEVAPRRLLPSASLEALLGHAWPTTTVTHHARKRGSLVAGAGMDHVAPVNVLATKFSITPVTAVTKHAAKPKPVGAAIKRAVRASEVNK